MPVYVIIFGLHRWQQQRLTTLKDNGVVL